MSSIPLTEKAKECLHHLCIEISNRRVGSPGNRAATDFFAEEAARFGFVIESPEFDCIDWTEEGAQLSVGGESLHVIASPYSPGGSLTGALATASTLEQLEAVEVANKILLLRGDIAKEPLMPKNFPFYNPDEHKRIIDLLERKRPLGIITATSHNPEMAGGRYPFPLLEDGDFDIPSVYTTEEEGDRLVKHAGEEISLDIHAVRIPSKGCNVIARKGENWERRIVFCAHIDAKYGTPGALDNAAGITVLLLLAELLKVYAGRSGVEIVAVNGEDYYSSPGEVSYLQHNQGRLGEILLGINLDGVGYCSGNTAYSLYNIPDEMAGTIRTAFSQRGSFVEGEQWVQGDHMLFVMNGIPALALTSERILEITTEITHTAKDRPELVDPDQLAQIALLLDELLHKL